MDRPHHARGVLQCGGHRERCASTVRQQGEFFDAQPIRHLVHHAPPVLHSARFGGRFVCAPKTPTVGADQPESQGMRQIVVQAYEVAHRPQAEEYENWQPLWVTHVCYGHIKTLVGPSL